MGRNALHRVLTIAQTLPEEDEEGMEAKGSQRSC